MDKIKVADMEPADQSEGEGNTGTRYTITFTGPVNANWLWDAIAEALKKHYKDHSEAEKEGK